MNGATQPALRPANRSSLSSFLPARLLPATCAHRLDRGPFCDQAVTRLIVDRCRRSRPSSGQRFEVGRLFAGKEQLQTSRRSDVLRRSVRCGWARVHALRGPISCLAPKVDEEPPKPERPRRLPHQRESSALALREPATRTTSNEWLPRHNRAEPHLKPRIRERV